jgi:hypothetical protein
LNRRMQFPLGIGNQWLLRQADYSRREQTGPARLTSWTCTHAEGHPPSSPSA